MAQIRGCVPQSGADSRLRPYMDPILVHSEAHNLDFAPFGEGVWLRFRLVCLLGKREGGTAQCRGLDLRLLHRVQLEMRAA